MSNSLKREAHILVLEMLEKLQFSVGALGQDRRAEWLHDLLDRNGLARELVLGRAGRVSSRAGICVASVRTTRDQRRPCPRAADRCIFAKSVAQEMAMWGVAAPARDLKRRAENLGAHEFSHGEGWL